MDNGKQALFSAELNNDLNWGSTGYSKKDIIIIVFI